MRHVVFALMAALCVDKGPVESPPAAPPTPVIMPDPPPLVLGTQRPDYAAAPASLPLPSDYSLENVQRARGNLAQWRDAERARLGDPYERNGRPRPGAMLPTVGGYFAVFSDTSAMPGIVYGSWRSPDIEIGGRSVFQAVLEHPYTICGGQAPWVEVSISDAAYLGNQWRPEFDVLDAALGGDADARMVRGRELPPETRVQFASPQLMPDVSRFYPSRALEREVEGQVLMSCRVEENHSLRCGVLGVAPENFSAEFGQAAVRAMRSARVRMAETTDDGQPSAGACIRRRIQFRLG